MSAGTLATTEAHGHSGRAHWQVGHLRKRCHSGASSALVPIPRGIDRRLRRGVPAVGLDEPDGNTGLCPHRPPLRHKPLGTIYGGEPTIGHRVLNSNNLAHSSGVGPDGIAGMPARRLQRGGRSFEDCALAPVGRTDPLLINTRRHGKTESAKCSFLVHRGAEGLTRRIQG